MANSSDSLVWKYFDKSEDGLEAYCPPCKKWLSCPNQQTSSLHYHLQSKHNITLDKKSRKRTCDDR